MFATKKYILFIEKSKLSIYVVTLNKNLISKKILESSWTLQILPELLFKIKKRLNKPLRILLSDEFVYTETIAIPENAENMREEVKIKAQELIPENLDTTLWDFKEMLILNTQSLRKKIVQVAAVTYEFYHKVYPLLLKNFEIEAVEPVSYALARFLRKINDAEIIIHISSLNSMIMVKNGLVLALENNEKEITFKDLTAFIDYCKKHFSVVPKNIYFCGNTKNFNLKNFETLGLKAEIHQFDPIVSLALKIDIKGADEQVLNLSSFSSKPRDNSEQKIILFLMLLTLFFIGSLGFLFFSKIGLDNLLKSLYAILR